MLMRKPTRLLLLGGILLGFSLIYLVQGSPPAPSLFTELQEKFISEHLVVAGVLGQELMIFPFSTEPFSVKFFGYDVGLAKPYDLRGLDAAELAAAPQLDGISEYYFWITEKGLKLLLTTRRDGKWPFDDEGDLLPSWTEQVGERPGMFPCSNFD
jgi:hypothetical protein